MTGPGDIPVGGTTGLGHTSTAGIDEAARWLVDMSERDWRKPIVSQLRERFGLTTKEAVEASVQANEIRLARVKAAR